MVREGDPGHVGRKRAARLMRQADLKRVKPRLEAQSAELTHQVAALGRARDTTWRDPVPIWIVKWWMVTVMEVT